MAHYNTSAMFALCLRTVRALPADCSRFAGGVRRRFPGFLTALRRRNDFFRRCCALAMPWKQEKHAFAASLRRHVWLVENGG